MPDLLALQKTLGVSFRDEALLQQSLVHSSYLNENPIFSPSSNERLEFLGDAVIELAVSEELYQRFPELPEGELTRMRSALICGENLARLARWLGLGDYLHLGRGEEQSGGRQRESNLASALEAVMGAVFLDQGFEVARRLALELFEPEIGELEVTAGKLVADYKSQLQEVAQARFHQTPAYQIVEVNGPDHERQFTAEVVIGEDVVGKGSGRSKQSAEKEAAHRALKSLGG